MALTFVISDTDAGFIELVDDKDAPSVSNGMALAEGDLVVAEPDGENNDQTWMFVHLEGDKSINGFVEVKFLHEPAPGSIIDVPLSLIPFVRSCARAEYASISPGSGTSMPVVADYLLAWAYVESHSDDQPFSNLKPDMSSSDAQGPFRLSSTDWKDYQASAERMGAKVSAFERHIPNSQVGGAAYKSLRDAEAFAGLINPTSPPVDGPHVPSYLNVFHCHLLGTAAAHKFHELKENENGSTSVSDALEPLMTKPKLDALLKDRKRFLTKDDVPVTVNMFFEITSQALSKGFKKALPLIREHADFLLPDLNTFGGDAPWLKVAREEKKLWDGEGLNEANGKGLNKVIEYFKSVNLETSENKPWCGAFVGHCLLNSDPSFKATIVKEGARAANWMNWGNINLRQFDLRDIPLGAIVVTIPLAKGASGHVGFFAGKVDGTEKVVVLGGNQSDKITEQHVHKNKIRHIRWHQELSTKGNTSIGSKTDPKFSNLLALIARKESGGNYNAFFGNSKNLNKPEFTKMSLAAVREWQDEFVREGSKSSAAGKYQIIRDTLDGLITSLNLTKSELYDENLQDAMAMQLISEKGLDAFLDGTISITNFGSRLAQVWAALPVLKKLTNNKNRTVLRGQSYYAGDGLNKAHVMPEEVESVLAELLEA
ncbi:hypothetical protein [Roseibium sp. MMSF_3412]|uniref:hypothetical protein n=1 Tax=Roseibium sp. MMSF_3412 TaxID=3046712 RepID=UPI00273E45B8|nr:hypothetical protein [Roseibium sp. MMSF_3412]